MEDEIHIYNQDFELLNSYNTYLNERGAIGFFPSEKSIVFPCKNTKGNINYVSLSKNVNISKEAHQNPIGLISVSPSGKKICTSSEGGTILQIFDTEKLEVIKRVRRGITNKVIDNVSFSYDENFFCTTSDGKVHVFSMNSELNSKSMLSSFGLGYVFSFVNEEKSFTEFEISNQGKIICKFDENDPNIIYVLTQEGNSYVMTYDKLKNIWKEKKQSFPNE